MSSNYVVNTRKYHIYYGLSSLFGYDVSYDTRGKHPAKPLMILRMSTTYINKLIRLNSMIGVTYSILNVLYVIAGGLWL